MPLLQGTAGRIGRCRRVIIVVVLRLLIRGAFEFIVALSVLPVLYTDTDHVAVIVSRDAIVIVELIVIFFVIIFAFAAFVVAVSIARIFIVCRVLIMDKIITITIPIATTLSIIIPIILICTLGFHLITILPLTLSRLSNTNIIVVFLVSLLAAAVASGRGCVSNASGIQFQRRAVTGFFSMVRAVVGAIR
jgi:hypothetical protein